MKAVFVSERVYEGLHVRVYVRVWWKSERGGSVGVISHNDQSQHQLPPQLHVTENEHNHV